MWIVKLGGSFYRSNELPLWLNRLALLKGGQAVIVPGGGPFADQVRRAQQRWKITDTCAHAMALLAMEQFGHLFLGLETRLRPAATCSDIKHILDQQQIPVWFPAAELLNLPQIPATWDVTSDSLAAWLSGRLQAGGLALVKQRRLSRQVISAAVLAQEGIVDAAFPRFLRSAQVSCYYLAADDYKQISADWSPEGGTRVYLC
jgi:5-(aminomethyl)-3-furanmethanol phosphate kinase